MTPNELNLTPVRVRGKRHNTAKSLRPKRKAKTSLSSHVRHGVEAQRKKRKVKLSRLEDLPTEVLELVFVNSCNPDLALASRTLASQLSGRRLQLQLMDVALGPMFEGHQVIPIADVVMLESMLARRFCTWSFLRTWVLRHNSDRSTEPNNDAVIRKFSHGATWAASCPRFFAHEQVAEGQALPGRLPRQIPIPEKLLHGPFTDDKLMFIEWLKYMNYSHVWDADERARMSSFDGLRDAVREGSTEAVLALQGLGVELDPDVLRFAIVEQGCDEAIVADLFVWLTLATMPGARLPIPQFDPLDPVLWAWLEQPAQKVKHGKGSFVKGLLNTYNARQLSRDPARSLV